MEYEAWREHALDEKIDKVVFSPETLLLTRSVAKEGEGLGAKSARPLPEQAGYLSGLVVDGVFYAVSAGALGSSSIGEINLDKPDFTTNFIHSAVAKALPNFKTVLYHSHPEINEGVLELILPECAGEVLDVVKMGIDSGLYDHVGNEGRGTLVNALTDSLSRTLSEEDIECTPGRYSLLVSPTLHKGNSFSHLNFYDISGDKQTLVECDSRNFHEDKNLINSLQTWKKVKDSSHKELWGFSRLDDASDKDFERMRNMMLCGLTYKDPRVPLEELLKEEYSQ